MRAYSTYRCHTFQHKAYKRQRGRQREREREEKKNKTFLPQEKRIIGNDALT